MPDSGCRNVTMQKRIVDAAGFIAGGVLGLLGALYSRWQAQAAVDVRPKLVEVGFVDAFLTNHGADWLFYHYPTAATVGMVLLTALVIGFGWTVMSQ